MNGCSEKSHTLVEIGGIVCCFLIGLFGLYSCIKPPIKEIANAEVALAAARSSGAEKYVKEKYINIEKKLAEARLRVEEHRYKTARILALESADEAWQVKSQAEGIKEKVRKDAENALTVAHKALCDLEEKRAIKYDIEEYMAILNLFREVQKEYDEERYSEVIKKAGSITQRCKSLQKKAQEIKAKQKVEKIRQLKEAGEKKKLEMRKKREAEKKLKMVEHVVQAGDSLWKICQEARVYNNPLIWPIVYKANRSQIRDPDLIYPGQKFIIPRELGGEAIDEAALEAKNRGPWSLYDNK